MTDELRALASGKYVSLRTFKRDGSAVATPVWITIDDRSLCIITESGSWKVRRIRNNPDVELAPCDMLTRDVRLLRPGSRRTAR